MISPKKSFLLVLLLFCLFSCIETLLEKKDVTPNSEIKKLEKKPLKNELKQEKIRKKDTLKPLRAEIR